MPHQEVDTERLLKEMYPEYLLVDYPETTNFAAAFGHLCGGYDAKYYSCTWVGGSVFAWPWLTLCVPSDMWSEVYSADMFYTRFKKEVRSAVKVGWLCVHVQRLGCAGPAEPGHGHVVPEEHSGPRRLPRRPRVRH